MRDIGVSFVLSTTIVLALVTPVAADPPMPDEELDHTTAGGQPAVISVGAGGSIDFNAETAVESIIAPYSQNGLKALVLNNVVGENQAATGFNISGPSQSGGQGNELNQSWGAVNETTGVSIAPVTVAADVACNGALICKGTPVVVALPGTIRVLTTTADQILNAGNGGVINYRPQTAISQEIDSNSQAGLVALVVNNVAGLNQVATAGNVSGGQVGLADSSLNVSGSGGAGAGQHNLINQFRGTPITSSR